MSDQNPTESLEEVEAAIARAEADRDTAAAQLEDRKEEVAVRAASETRAAKGKELAQRTFDGAIARLTRDGSELPEIGKLSDRKMRTGFALLKSSQASQFNGFVSQVVEMIQDYDGDIVDLKYGLDRSTHFVALTYNMPSSLFDVLPTAIVQLKRLHSA